MLSRSFQRYFKNGFKTFQVVLWGFLGVLEGLHGVPERILRVSMGFRRLFKTIGIPETLLTFQGKIGFYMILNLNNSLTNMYTYLCPSLVHYPSSFQRCFTKISMRFETFQVDFGVSREFLMVAMGF